MSLLFEEFFEKIFKVGKGHFTLSILIKIIFFIIIAGILVLLTYSLISGDFWIFYIIGGGFIIAEIAHKIRKSREKVMVKKFGFKKKKGKKFLESKKVKNKNLLNVDKTKNRGLLKSNKTKNKDLLKKSPKNRHLLKR